MEKPVYQEKKGMVTTSDLNYFVRIIKLSSSEKPAGNTLLIMTPSAK